MDKNSFVCKMDESQSSQLRDWLESRGWEIDTLPYARFRARKDKTTVAAYESGKVTIQGRGTAELVEFYVEPEILHQVTFGYEDVLAREANPQMYEPHAGIDESGKGDFFGPMVIACVYVDADSADKLVKAGVTDSKAIKSDKRIETLAKIIRSTVKGRYALIRIGPSTYNRMYGTMRNVNRMLAWGHARALENLLEKVPNCTRAISDQFGPKSTVQRALLEKGRKIELEQRPKAESDIAVAAASILARQGFVEQMNALGEQVGLKLPRGASKMVVETAAALVNKVGEDGLADYAKMHFRTTENAVALAQSDEPPGELPDLSAIPDDDAGDAPQ